MATVYEERAKVFKALCDERRQRILELLHSGEKCACVLIEEMSLPPAAAIRSLMLQKVIRYASSTSISI